MDCSRPPDRGREAERAPGGPDPGASPGRLARWLAPGRPCLTGGAIGTELQRLGLPPGEASDAWNLSHPGAVAGLARSDFEAGSRVVLTNTFQANPVALAARGLGDRWADINRAGVALARAGAPGAGVFGSIGPVAWTGASPAAVAGAIRDQARALADAGADALVLETFTDLDELVVAVGAARAAGLPVVASACFGPEGTLGGVPPEEVARRLAEAGADAVGANCGDGPAPFARLCPRLRSGAGGRPVWIRPNAGVPSWQDGRCVYPIDPEGFAAALIAIGADFLGGCCGAGVEWIRALGGRIERGGGTKDD